jgi:5-methylcytosine-specific restriction endonuclease McrA
MNPRRKRGEVREDGKVFWCRDRGKEVWIDRTKFEQRHAATSERGKKWQRDNPEKTLARAARYRKRHPERSNESARRWRANHPEKARETVRRWASKNPSAIAVKEQNRRARQKRATPADGREVILRQTFEIADRVTKCTGIKHVVDHIVPLVCGGSHCHRNVQVLPFTLNNRKGGRINYDLPACYRRDGWRVACSS